LRDANSVNRLGGYIDIFIAASLWGSSATIAKFLFRQNIPPLLLVQSRVIIAAMVLILFHLAMRPQIMKIKILDFKDFALLGIIGVAGATYTYYSAIKETSVAVAILMQYTAPVLVALYLIVTKREKISRIKMTAVIMSFAGCTIMLGIFGSDVRITALGIFLGVLSAFCFAFFNVFAKKAHKNYSVWTVLTYTMIGASTFWVVSDLFIDPRLEILDTRIVETLFIFSLVSMLIPYVFYLRGLKKLKPSTAIVVSTLEPVVAIFTAFIFLGETLQGMQVAGGVLVIAAVILLEVYRE